MVDPEGVAWEVSRRWLKLPRWRSAMPDSFPDFGPGDEGLGVTLFVLLLVLLFFLVGLPLLLFAAGVVLAVGGLAIRILFGRPWLVEAKSARGELQWHVRGVRRSRQAIEEIAAALARGERDVSPRGAERLLPDSPLSTGEPGSNVRVLDPRE